MIILCKLFGCKPCYHCSGCNPTEWVDCERCGAELIPYGEYHPSLNSRFFRNPKPQKGFFKEFFTDEGDERYR